MHDYKGFVIFLTHSHLKDPKEPHIIIAANDTVPAVINTTENIGDEVNINYKVRNRSYNDTIKGLVLFLNLVECTYVLC